ncbi:hypothetical protein CR513_46989, partial [Mucuna pruriens]
MYITPMRNRLLTRILCLETMPYPPPPGFQYTTKRWWRLQPKPDRHRLALSGLVELMPAQYVGFPKSGQVQHPSRLRSIHHHFQSNTNPQAVIRYVYFHPSLNHRWYDLGRVPEKDHELWWPKDWPQPPIGGQGPLYVTSMIVTIPVCYRTVSSRSNTFEEVKSTVHTWLRKLCPIHAWTPDLISWRQWGSHLKGKWRRTFEGKYGNLLGLLEIKVQPEALLALTQYYDPPLKCFIFRGFQLAPTLEENKRILGMPLGRSLITLRLVQYDLDRDVFDTVSTKRKQMQQSQTDSISDIRDGVELDSISTEMQEIGANRVQTQGVNSVNLSSTKIAMDERRWFTFVSQDAENQIHQSVMASQTVPSDNLRPLNS